MLTIPTELQGHECDNRLVVDGGQINDIAAVSAYLKQQRHLTTIAISEAVDMPEWDGNPAGHELALALANCPSPNLLKAAIVGGDFADLLGAKCAANRRNAIDLLDRARDTTHVLKANECQRIKECLPAIVTIANATGAHGMSQPELIATLERIALQAEQYNIDTGVNAFIDRFRPKPAQKPAVEVTSATRPQDGKLVQFCQYGAFPPLGG